MSLVIGVCSREDVDLQLLATYARIGYEGDRLICMLGMDGITSSFVLASARRLRALGLLESDPSAKDEIARWRITEKGERVARRLGKYITEACALEGAEGAGESDETHQ